MNSFLFLIWTKTNQTLKNPHRQAAKTSLRKAFQFNEIKAAVTT